MRKPAFQYYAEIFSWPPHRHREIDAADRFNELDEETADIYVFLSSSRNEVCGALSCGELRLSMDGTVNLSPRSQKLLSGRAQNLIKTLRCDWGAV